MRQSVVQLDNFYASRLGAAAKRMVARRLDSLWSDLQGHDILGFGFASPYVLPYLEHSKRVVLAMPGGQGAAVKTSKRGIISCLTHEDLLPFSDAQFDTVLVAHGVEEAGDLKSLLTELWRVTKPEGRIVIIAANRAGLWARSENSPFGSGRPFSRRQLRMALRDVGYMPSVWSGALYTPPIGFLSGPKLSEFAEQFGETVWPKFSGLVLVEAIKRLYAEPEGLGEAKAVRTVRGTAPIGNAAPSFDKT